jgi:Asp/Glu/hydantoin racemase
MPKSQLDPENRNFGKVGILTLDRNYRLVKENIARADSHHFPVVIKRVKGLYNPPSPPLRDQSGNLNKGAELFLNALKDLTEQDTCIKAVIGSCGFFSLLQQEVSQWVSLPVYTSPLLLVPFAQNLISQDMQVGIITLYKEYLTSEHFESIPAIDLNRVILSDMSQAAEFRRMIEYDNADVDEKLIQKEVLQAATNLVKSNRSIGAIVVECSDMPPYSRMIREVLGLPVYDYRTLADIAYNSFFSGARE